MDLGKCSIPKSVFLEQQMKALDGTGGYPSKLDPQFHLTFTPIQRARPSVLGDSTWCIPDIGMVWSNTPATEEKTACYGENTQFS